MGIKWPQWHTFFFERQGRVDMRLVCPEDMKKMLRKQARPPCWKKWAAKHQYEELKEGVWFVPTEAMLRKKMDDEWTDKHRNVLKKLLVEGGWVQKRLFDIGWSNEDKCQRCNKEEGTEKHRLYQCPCWKEVRSQMPEELRKSEQRARTSKKDWKWQ